MVYPDIDKFVEQYRPFTIGFEKVFDNLNTISDIKNNYPPTTSSNKGKNSSSSKLPLLVFVRMSSTSMLYQRATNLLSKVHRIVEKIQKDLHKGIGARNLHDIRLTDDVKVVSVDFDVGMLYISLEKIVPEEKKPKEIKVIKGQPQFLQE